MTGSEAMTLWISGNPAFTEPIRLPRIEVDAAQTI